MQLQEDCVASYADMHRVCVAAKKYLSGSARSEMTSYICFALRNASEDDPSLKDAAVAVAEKIHERLGDAATVGEWLCNEGHIPRQPLLWNYQLKKEIQAYRHRWLDALAQEFAELAK